jgi:hypothetical protein
MDFDEDKIDAYTLALLYLVTHENMKDWGPGHGRDLTGTP